MRREAEMGKINLGNKGLTKLWNLNPDNLGKLVQNLLIFWSFDCLLAESYKLIIRVFSPDIWFRSLARFFFFFVNWFKTWWAFLKNNPSDWISEACKDVDRNFLPGLESYFEDAIMEIDPVNKVGP